MKKKWELLKYAYDNYPKGTKINWGFHPDIFECSGEYLFKMSEGSEIIADSIDSELAVWNGDTWAKIINPNQSASKHFIISEDGETLYDGDKYFHVHQVDGIWKLNKSFEPDYALAITSTSKVITDPDHNKAFSKYDAAIKFIASQMIIVSKDSSYQIHVTSDSIIVQTKSHCPGENLVFSVEEMEECVSIYKLLNDENT